jgi:hypothetical protein
MLGPEGGWLQVYHRSKSTAVAYTPVDGRRPPRLHPTERWTSNQEALPKRGSWGEPFGGSLSLSLCLSLSVVDNAGLTTLIALWIRMLERQQ